MYKLKLPIFASFTLMVCTLMVTGCSGASDESEQDSSEAASEQLSSGFEISSTEFSDERPRKRLANQFTCHGGDMSPPLSWKGWPEDTQSFVLISEDADHETGIWVHWVLHNIPVGVSKLDAGIPTTTETLPDGTTQGTNDFRNIGYNGPCIPLKVRSYTSQPSLEKHGPPPHRFYFRLYALDTILNLSPGAKKTEVVSAMENHILAQTETMGKNTTQVTLEGKGGRGSLETAAKKGEEGFKSAIEATTTTGEKIYNSLGELVTPTPSAR